MASITVKFSVTKAYNTMEAVEFTYTLPAPAYDAPDGVKAQADDLSKNIIEEVRRSVRDIEEALRLAAEAGQRDVDRIAEMLKVAASA